MEAWCPQLLGYAGPKYQAVADALGEAIERGELRPGDRLPPQRALAGRLGFDLTTITKAYDLARQRGLIVARGRAGSFVREGVSTSLSGGQQVDTGMNCPPAAAGNLLQVAMAEALQEVLASGELANFQYQCPGGALDVRRAGALLLTRIGLRSEPDQVVVTAGGQNALHAILGSIVRPGDRIACGQFVYPGFRALAQRRGAQLVPLPEMTAKALQAACSQGTIRALYVVPTNDNPTAATVAMAERAEIAAVARLEGLQIVEDDAYGLLAKEQMAPVSSFAPDHSWYVLSTSKIISPVLRVAFLRAPAVGQALQLSADVHETAVMAPPVNAAMVASWLRDGTFDQLVSGTRNEAAWRQKLARRILGQRDYACHPQGYHLWLKLPCDVAASDISQSLRGAGIGSVPSDGFAVSDSREQALRISLGGMLDRAGLASALRAVEGHVSASLKRWDALV